MTVTVGFSKHAGGHVFRLFAAAFAAMQPACQPLGAVGGQALSRFGEFQPQVFHCDLLVAFDGGVAVGAKQLQNRATN